MLVIKDLLVKLSWDNYLSPVKSEKFFKKTAETGTTKVQFCRKWFDDRSQKS